MLPTPQGHRVPSAAWWLLGAGVVLRLALVPLPGYDVEAFQTWSDALAREGLTQAYELNVDNRINYPPVSLYVFWALGLVYQSFAGASIPGSVTSAAAIKLAIIAADAAAIVALTILLHSNERENEQHSLPWVAAYALHPAVMWNTAYWAGIDAMDSLTTLLALLFLLRGRFDLALALATVGVLVKPLAAPLWLLTMWVRIRVQGPSTIPSALAVSTGTALLLYAPWLVHGKMVSAILALGQNLGNYPVLSANAHNVWWVLSGGDGWQPDSGGLNFISYRLWSLLALLAALVWGLRLVPRQPDRRQIFHASAYVLMALPMLVTEVHENWALTAIPPLVAACAVDSRIRPVFYLLLITTLLNLALHDDGLQSAMGSSWDETVLLPMLRLGNAVIATASFAFWTARLPNYMTRLPP